jgi:hypothetical protein
VILKITEQWQGMEISGRVLAYYAQSPRFHPQHSERGKESHCISETSIYPILNIQFFLPEKKLKIKHK